MNPGDSDDDDSADEGDNARGRRDGTSPLSSISEADAAKRIKKESLGIFDPTCPYDIEKTGLVITANGK